MSETEQVSAEGAGNTESAQEPHIEEGTKTEAVQDNAADWRSALPEDIRDTPSISKFTNLEALAKSYVNLEKMMGADKVPIPKQGDEEGLERFYRAAGWPETAEGYKFEKPTEIPEGLEYDEKLDQRLRNIMHSAKLDPRQATAVRAELMKLAGEGALENVQASQLLADEEERQRTEAEAQLKREWGKAYEQNAKIAGRAINKLFGPELTAVFEQNGLGDHPTLVRAALDMGKKLIGEKNLIGEGFTEQTPQDLETAIAEHRKTYAAELLDKAHPDHDLRTKELTALYEKLYN